MHRDWQHSRVRDAAAMVLTLGPGPQAARDHDGPGSESKSDSKLPAGGSVLHSSYNLMMIRDSDTQAWTRILRPRNRNVTVENASSFWIERTGPPRWRPGPCLLQVAGGRWSESDSKSDSKLRKSGTRTLRLGLRF